MEIEVIKPGTKVILAKDIDALIVGAYINSDTSVNYEVAWWDKNDRKTCFLRPAEFTVGEKETVRIRLK